MKHYPHHIDLQPAARARGSVRLPGSKSISNRMLLLAALAEGQTEIKSLLASGAKPLEARMVIGYTPCAEAGGVPASRPFVLRVTPAGKVPCTVKTGAGKPKEVNQYELFTPARNDIKFLPKMTGLSWTVNVNAWLASGAAPLEALIVIEYTPPAPPSGVP